MNWLDYLSKGFQTAAVVGPWFLSATSDRVITGEEVLDLVRKLAIVWGFKTQIKIDLGDGNVRQLHGE